MIQSNNNIELEAQKLYTPKEVAEMKIATKDTLARWRMEKQYLPFIKAGSKVLYKGADIIAFLEANKISPIA